MRQNSRDYSRTLRRAIPTAWLWGRCSTSGLPGGDYVNVRGAEIGKTPRKQGQWRRGKEETVGEIAHAGTGFKLHLFIRKRFPENRLQLPIQQ